MRHKHADLIHAWAEGAEIQILSDGEWRDCKEFPPTWGIASEYRIKPEKKPDVVCYYFEPPQFKETKMPDDSNLKLTFDGETGKLIKAEVL